MQYLNNLPVIVSACSGIIIGIYGYVHKLPNTTIYKYMCLFIIVFYFIGLMIKWTFIGIQKEFDEREKNAPLADGLVYLNAYDDTDTAKEQNDENEIADENTADVENGEYQDDSKQNDESLYTETQEDFNDFENSEVESDAENNANQQDSFEENEDSSVEQTGTQQEFTYINDTQT